MFQGMEYVYAVYQAKSFSKAAKELFISQPSLSASVKRNENKVGYPIFDRSTKPLQLTEYGEHYIHAVEQIMSVKNEFVNCINDLGELKTGSLTIGGSSLFASLILPPILSEFGKKFPMIKVELIEETTVKLNQFLRNGTIDMVLDNCILDDETFDWRPLREEHLMLAVPELFAINEKLKAYQVSPEMIRSGAHLDETVKEVNLQEFQGQPFVLLKKENDTRVRANLICQRQGFEPQIMLEVDQQMTAYNIANSGMAIAFVSDTLAMRVPRHSGVVYYKLSMESNRREVHFYWKKGRYISRAMQEFLKIANK